ncbi:MAG: hypothetical protein JXR30_02640 [Alphaproteobacteria bacterium]|nr:hypothetical protein [Alphaproteobacteria bacterium]
MRLFFLFFVGFVSFFSWGADASLMTLPYTLLQAAAGDSVVALSYASNALCWSCPYVLQLLDMFSFVSLSVFEHMGQAMVKLMGAVFVLWIAYKVAASFFGLSVLDESFLSKSLLPKFFAMIIVVPLLYAPTPKLIFNYIVEPIVDLGAAYGKKAMTLVSGKDMTGVCLFQYAGSEYTKTTEGAFSPSFRQTLTCLISQNHQINALGIALGTTLFMEATAFKNSWLLGLLPNFGMLLAGLIIALGYFAALVAFPFFVVEALFNIGFVLAFLPFLLFSFVASRGQEKIPFFGDAFGTAFGMLKTASLQLMFLPFFLSISHLIFQTMLDSEMMGYQNLIKPIQEGDIDAITSMLQFGSKEMLMLAFFAFLSFKLIASAKTVAGWFSAGYSENLYEYAYGNFKKGTQWLRKKGAEKGNKIFEKTKLGKMFKESEKK